MNKKVVGWVLFLALIGIIMGGIVESTGFIFDTVYGSKISSLFGSIMLYVVDIALIITILVVGFVGINYVNIKFLED